MPTPLSNVSIENILNQIKPEIRQMGGYVTPPQGEVRAKLNQNENPFDFPVEWKQELAEYMPTISWARYPANEAPGIRTLLADRFGLLPDQVMLGNGSNQLLYTIILAIIGRGDKMLMASPSFSLFDLVGTLFQGAVVQVLLNDDFSINETKFMDHAKDARLILLCSPNNPTGNEIPLTFLEMILCSTPAIVMWDEAYSEFSDQTAVNLIEKYPNLVVSRTFSKAFGLAGLRIGYFLGDKRIIAELRKANLPYNLNLFSERVARQILDNDAWIQKHVHIIVDEREKLYRAMQQINGLHVYPSKANFLLFKVNDGSAVLKSLQDMGILVRNMGSYPLLANHLRVTVGTPEENQIFIEGIKEVLAKIHRVIF